MQKPDLGMDGLSTAAPLGVNSKRHLLRNFVCKNRKAGAKLKQGWNKSSSSGNAVSDMSLKVTCHCDLVSHLRPHARPGVKKEMLLAQLMPKPLPSAVPEARIVNARHV